MTLERSLGLDRRLFYSCCTRNMIEHTPDSLGTFGTTCNAAWLAAMSYLVQDVQMTLCHDNSAIPIPAWPLGPTGKVFVVNHSARHKILVHPLLLIDSCTSSMTLRLGYSINDHVM